jgi:hypothetical protein
MTLAEFFSFLTLTVECALHICETAIMLTLIWVYGRLAIRHILALGKKEN